MAAEIKIYRNLFRRWAWLWFLEGLNSHSDFWSMRTSTGFRSCAAGGGTDPLLKGVRPKREKTCLEGRLAAGFHLVGSNARPGSVEKNSGGEKFLHLSIRNVTIIGRADWGAETLFLLSAFDFNIIIKDHVYTDPVRYARNFSRAVRVSKHIFVCELNLPSAI